jgi:hypothetical protein
MNILGACLMLLEIILVLLFLFAALLVPGLRRKIVLVSLFAAGVLLYMYPWLVYPFRPERWVSASPFERRILAKGFLQQFDPLGMSRDQVENVLGPADWGDYWYYDLKVPLDAPTYFGDNHVELNLGVSFKKTRVARIDYPWNDALENKIPFDSASWKSGSLEERSKMIWDIKDRRLIDSKSTKEVRELLGEPNRGSKAERIEYDLGMYPFLAELDVYGLLFQLDVENKVTSAGIVQH